MEKNAEESQRNLRLSHVRTAIAGNRIEGMEPSDVSLEICAAYVRGEIPAKDLVNEVKKRLLLSPRV